MTLTPQAGRAGPAQTKALLPRPRDLVHWYRPLGVHPQAMDESQVPFKLPLYPFTLTAMVQTAATVIGGTEVFKGISACVVRCAIEQGGAHWRQEARLDAISASCSSRVLKALQSLSQKGYTAGG